MAIARPNLRILDLPWMMLLCLIAILGFGIMILYSAARGDMDPWASRQLLHILIGSIIMLVISLTDIRFWFQSAWWAYGLGIALLCMVHIVGVEGGLGAQRWLSIFGFRFQPSELMKICLLLVLARYYQLLHPNNINRWLSLLLPLCITGIAVLLIFLQPNLGTSVITTAVAAIVLFLAGVSWKKFFLAGLIVAAMLPIGWNFLHDYQKERVYTFLSPERDPLGTGYNIIQSKIAIGSGGISGKGLTQGTQTQLSFVPEKQTDFIFVIVAEELGFIGVATLLALYGGLLLGILMIAMRANSPFSRLMAGGVAGLLFIHLTINVGMVSGMLPVVGVPLPLLSYGGSSMISMLIGMGFVLNAHIYRDLKLPNVA